MAAMLMKMDVRLPSGTLMETVSPMIWTYVLIQHRVQPSLLMDASSLGQIPIMTDSKMLWMTSPLNRHSGKIPMEMDLVTIGPMARGMQPVKAQLANGSPMLQILIPVRKNRVHLTTLHGQGQVPK